MCGIAVVLGEPPDEEARRFALESLRHRGPDGTNSYEEEGIFIGHTRLAILDLSDAAQQPMRSPDGRFVLAYNGEIYNYLELRRSLGRRWPWRGSGDTETLLALLALEGTKALPKVRGMFAFVLWDREERTLVAARDPLGIKPLYYAHNSSATLLASELRTIRALGAGDRIDQAGLESFLLTGAVQGPRTIFQGVCAVKPGHVMTIAEGRRVERPYWQLPDEPAKIRPRRQIVHDLDDLLAESVRIELRSDVPVGTFLSGGLDSSLITSYAARELGHDLHTYSVGFESQDRHWDETSAAALVSERYGTQHHRIVVTRSDFESRLDELPRAIDQPSVDGVNSYFVSGAAAGQLKVALSGQGGDELFAGYNLFQFASRLAALNERLPRLPRAAARLGRSIVRLPARAQKNWYLLAVAGVLTRGDPDVLDAAGHPLFSYREIGARPPVFASDTTANGDLVNAISRRLITGYLRNTLLRDMDAMSMAHSLEVRVPLVDHKLAEFALSIPGSQKVAWGDSKSLLRDVARARLPAELLQRKKQGFVFPLAEWLAHPSCYTRVSEALAPDRVKATGLVDPALVARELRRIRRPFPGDVRWLRAQRVWGLFVLHEWYDHWQETGRSGKTGAAAAS